MYAIDSARTYDWATYCGIPGGIPTRTTIYQTMTTANTASQINAAITACPAGQVVKLAAGTYNLSISLGSNKNKTLRGNGAGSTIINGTVSCSGSSFDWTGGDALASGYTKDSLSVVVAGTGALPSSYAAGNLILIDQEDDNTLVFHRTGNWAGTRNLRHVSRITGVVGRAVTFATPLPYTLVAGQSPACEVITVGASNCGIEDMTINNDRCVGITGSERIWIKDCELKGFDNEAVYAQNACNIELNRCYIHDAAGFPDQSDGYGLYTQYAVSCVKMVDCVGYKMAYMTVLNGNDSSAYLYNYVWHMGRAGYAWQNPAYNCNHGPHSIMNLWEGNFGERWQNDAYHGSASHQTIFRNHIHGKHPTYTLDRRIMDFCRTSYYFNAVGNIVGDSSWNPTYYQASKVTGTGYYTGSLDRSQGYLWVLGYPNMGSGSLTAETAFTGFTPPGGTYPDSNVAATLIRHGNYDYYNDAVVNADGEDTELPNSLFYTSKPDWFGDLTWPPINPTTPTAGDIPAKYRWDAYVESSNLDDIFHAEYTDESGVVYAAGSAGAQSSASASAYLQEPPSPPGFNLSIAPTSQQVRKPNEAAYFVEATAFGGYVANIALSVTGLPAGGAYTLDTNPIAYNGDTTLRIDTSGIEATDPTTGTDYNLKLVGIESA